MEKFSLIILINGVFILISNFCLTSSVSVFVSRQTAQSVLLRQKRFNKGGLEEVMRDNLERECMEEKCNFEEAREVFENMEKTRVFWMSYIDGDQCLSSPCQNGGTCKDGLSSYVCWCPISFIGKNCELDLERQCDVNNGGCMQFCEVDKVQGVVCMCADGYTLGADERSCEPRDNYPCGRLGKNIANKLATRTLLTEETVNQTHGIKHVTVTERNLTTANSTNSTDRDWGFFPTLPSITEETNTKTRIVGGLEVASGEVPWQAALVHKEKKLVFCGGSLLSDVWVITAAHCLVEAGIGKFFVRLGEHDVNVDEHRESDHEVDEHHIHPSYQHQQSHNHDIALLKLSTPVTFSDYIIPICLGPKTFTESLLKSVSVSLVSGWGRIRYRGVESERLQKVEVPFVDRTECKGSDKISRFMFCAGFLNTRKDSCQGDSGGPHATRLNTDTWFLTGIISWGDECAKEGKYGVYTRVSKYMNWITNVTGIKVASSG
ncbi:coagulation factor IXb isoform X1 [Tachysurus fulvidraco]|uniref:coagulation factor IXb isoform X1 n=2 Tax=Tachysurus fulvidraco TaxID=1234273 RepID=UPI001FEE1031|nr:coagulation factor IXb isoform X1 [Tachysurus fulvidraco]